MNKYDVIVIGGGHNGLVNAAYLAKAGRKVLVLERRHVLGGAAVTEEIFPGFKFSVASYVVSLLRPEIIRELDLPRHGLEILPLDGTFTPMPGGDYLWRVNDHAKTRREIARHSKLDAEAYDEYGKAMIEMGRFVKPILTMTPPDPTSLEPRGLMNLLFLGRRFQALSDHDKYNQVQLMTMSAVDFLDQWFETDALKATMAASGIIGTFLGVRSPGTAYVLLHHYMGEIDGAFRSWGLSRGGTGAISLAIADAAREAGAEIRTEVAVSKIIVKDGAVGGVVLANGDYITADVVASSVDPHLTFLKMVGTEHLPGEFVDDVKRYKFRGSSGKVNLALEALPDFTARRGPGRHLRGAISISPSVEYMERAYRRGRVRPLFPPAVRRHRHSQPDRPLGRAPGQARHVLFRPVRAVQPEGGRHLGRSPRGLRRRRHRRHRGIRAEHKERHPASTSADAARHRTDVWPHRREHLPGRAHARAAVLPATRPGMGSVQDAGEEPLYVRLGDPPRRRNHGGAGEKCGEEDPEGRPEVSSIVLIGSGHNGLATAFYLAKAGHKVTVLERRSVVGGCAATEEFALGFKAPLANSVGPMRRSVIRDMGLASRAQFLHPDPRLVALSPDGRALAFSADIGRTSEAIGAFSQNDARRYPEFCETLRRLGAFLSGIFDTTPPSLNAPAAGEMWEMVKVGKRFRGLGRADAFRLLRWGPMAAADLVAEWFETDLLQAAVASRGVFGTAMGPWSAGSGAVLLLNAAIDAAPGGSSVMVKGGPAALATAMADAARSADVHIRTGATVARILVRDGRATGVALADGTETAADAVISNADPKRTFLDLVDPVDLDPDFLTKVRNYRARGTVAKVHLALNALPTFRGVANPADLHGRIIVAPGIDYLERAFDAWKYGELPQEPFLDISVPTLSDPSLAPVGKHVMSIHVQFVPYTLAGDRHWNDARQALAATVLSTLDKYAPGIGAAIETAQVISPVDLEQDYGLTGGHIYHGELSLDQLFTMRPILGWARYRTPIHNLFLCGSGTHPGGGITAASGQNAAREIALALKAG